MTKSANVVLLVEDDPKIGRFIRAGLELSGYVVHEARGAFEALRLATSSPPDLVILDSVLPDFAWQRSAGANSLLVQCSGNHSISHLQ